MRLLLDRLNVVTDLAVLFLSIVLSYTVRFHIFDSTENHLLLSYYLLFVLALLPIHYLIFSTFDLICVFRTRTFSEEVVKLIQANTVMAGTVTAILFVMKWHLFIPLGNGAVFFYQHSAFGRQTFFDAVVDELFAGKRLP